MEFLRVSQNTKPPKSKSTKKAHTDATIIMIVSFFIFFEGCVSTSISTSTSEGRANLPEYEMFFRESIKESLTILAFSTKRNRRKSNYERIIKKKLVEVEPH